jgi:anti-sigma regulatory factor (Ser/Thr protein kinase)
MVEIGARIEATGPPLGAGYFGMEPEVLTLRPEDVVVLYTDGLVERRGEDLFSGIEDLADRVRAQAGRPMREVPARLVADMVGEGGDDDVALVMVRIGEPDARVLTARLDNANTAPGQARRAVARQLAEWRIGGEAVADLVLMASELVTNAFVHARPPIDLRMRRTDQQVVLEVQDRAVLRPRRRLPEDSDEHGRGLNIVEILADEWGTHTSEAGKTVWCSIKIAE